jgi:nicotinate-nucleotide pyrophosphorylase (carboxylating)
MTTALPFTRPPHRLLVEPIVRHALEEDLGRAGDITSELTVPNERRVLAALVARKPGVVAGLVAAECAFNLVDPALRITVELPDGSNAESGARLAVIEGSARSILTAERVSLNFTGHLSGIATATRALVDAVAGTKARIVETRKTTPGLRLVEKYAVRCGGGFNHRFGLDDAVLIKDNHVAIAGGIRPAVMRARVATGHLVKIEVAVDTLDQLDAALELGVDAVLLDNMTPELLACGVARVAGRAITEASGGITVATAPDVAAAGVDLISVGWLTHSAAALDIGLDHRA